MEQNMDGMSRRQKRMLAQQRMDMQALLSADFGRRFLRRLLDVTGVFACADEGSTLQELAAHNARRAFGLWLIERVIDESQDPGALVRLMQEAVGTAVYEGLADKEAMSDD